MYISEQLKAFLIIALILSVVAAVLTFIFIVPERKKDKLNKFGKFLHNTFNFKYLIVEKILKALYIILTAFVIIFGFFMLFYVEEGGWFSSSEWYGGYGLLLMLLGPVIVRLVYELLMMIVLLVKNVISINNKLKNQNDVNNAPDIFATPDLSKIKESFIKKADDTAEDSSSQTPEAPQT